MYILDMEVGYSPFDPPSIDKNKNWQEYKSIRFTRMYSFKELVL